MNESKSTTPNTAEEYETFLPEGWAEGDDIFDMASWTGNAKTDESEAAEGNHGDEGSVDIANTESPITGQGNGEEVSGEVGDQSSTTEPVADSAKKLKFSAQIDHKVEEVEMDESDLPAVYQKAHVTDRVKAKLAQAQPIIDKGNRLAKLLGYESMEAMLESAESNYRQGEIDKLTNDHVHPEVAEELVNTRLQRAFQDVPAQATEDDEDTRDFKAEVTDLLNLHSELKGQRLPEEVVRECVANNRPLVKVYEEYIGRKKEAEATALRAENKTLKQNAEAARRAPVRGVTKGGAVDAEPDDPFLKGFNSAY